MDKRIVLLVLLGLLVAATLALWPQPRGDVQPQRADAGPVTPPPRDTPKPPPSPNPDLNANEVIRLIVDALQDNDSPAPDSGLALAFRFASPANRRRFGSLDRFCEMARSPVYQPLINHHMAQYGVIVTRDTQVGRIVSQAVWVFDRHGRGVAFTFMLTKQKSGKYKDCWMTDAVMPLRPRETPGPDRGPRSPDRGPDRDAKGRGGVVI